MILEYPQYVWMFLQLAVLVQESTLDYPLWVEVVLEPSIDQIDACALFLIVHIPEYFDVTSLVSSAFLSGICQYEVYTPLLTQYGLTCSMQRSGIALYVTSAI